MLLPVVVVFPADPVAPVVAPPPGEIETGWNGDDPPGA